MPCIGVIGESNTSKIKNSSDGFFQGAQRPSNEFTIAEFLLQVGEDYPDGNIS